MAENSGILGIDAGGTFTDLVFLAKADMSVLASVKVPTRHHDLPSTIRDGIGRILETVDAERIAGVHLATTLATNATVEGKLATAGLMLIGYDENDVNSALERRMFGDVQTFVLPGGHDIRGNEREPLDEALVLCACEELLDKRVSGIAVSGYFSVRNPSHEIRVRDLLRERHPSLSITCGHELASELDAFKRATTAAVNAGLIPIVMRLLGAVKKALREYDICAPLSVIKGDGSLVNDEWAERHPIETVVSGPAASAMGARFLGHSGGRARTSWILDIGGTTTDIIGLDKSGNPILKNDGAMIGGHQILIKTIDIRTFGLGGDSHVSCLRTGDLKIGPRKAIPLAVAACENPDLIPLLRQIEASIHPHKELAVFFPGEETAPEDRLEEIVIGKLRGGIATLDDLTDGQSVGTSRMIEQNIDRYEERKILKIAAFTPTDALLALGMLDKWPNEASLIGARILAANKDSPDEMERFCQRVGRKVSELAANELIRKALINHKLMAAVERDNPFLKIALSGSQSPDSPHIGLKINADVIGVGAPSWAFLGETASLLGEAAILPENAGVAGAVGASVGTFFMHHTLLITPLKSGDFRAHLPDGIHDFDDLESAVEKSVSFMAPWLEKMSYEAGAQAVGIDWERQDETARISGGTQEVLLWTRVLFSVRDKED